MSSGHANAAQRAKRLVKRLLDEGGRIPKYRRTQAGLAKALGLQANGISAILNAEDVPNFKMRDLDKIAEYFGIPPAMLIKRDDDVLWEVTPSEMRVLRIWREWPREIQQGVLELLAYFQSIAPAEKVLRRHVSRFRRLSRADQEYVERTMDSLLRHSAAPGTTSPAVPER